MRSAVGVFEDGECNFLGCIIGKVKNMQLIEYVSLAIGLQNLFDIFVPIVDYWSRYDNSLNQLSTEVANIYNYFLNPLP